MEARFFAVSLLLLLAARCRLALPPSSYETTIAVNSSDPAGTCSEQSSRRTCGNLTEALLQAHDSQPGRQSVRIKLSAGCFVLDSNAVTTFDKWKDFGIFGEPSAQPSSECVESPSDASTARSQICCEGEAVGMAFYNSSGIVMKDVLFSGCHAQHTSTSVSNKQADSFEKFQVALYFLACSDVEMYSVTMCSIEDVSVVLYNTNGSNVFENCHFDNCYNSFSGNNNWGGAGVMIEFTYCLPGEVSCKGKASQVLNEDVNYNFTTCTFCDNNATIGSSSVSYRPVYPHGADHTAFGKGGGLSLHFKGKSYRNNFFIKDCLFSGNRAELGNGLYLGFMDESANNSVIVSGNKFFGNMYGCGMDATKWKSSGGGARIEFIHYPPDSKLWPNYTNDIVGNAVSFSDVFFRTNKVCLGGAVSFVTSRDKPDQSTPNSLKFDRCKFRSNQASIGGAIDLSLFGPDTAEASGAIQPPLFTNCNFSYNQVTHTNYTNYKSSQGNVYANQVPVYFAGSTIFDSNTASALAVKGTHVSVLKNSVMAFTRNTGRNGAAISFIGKAWLVAYENTNFFFTNNSVSHNGLGGAIYAAQFGEHGSILDQNCFFRYFQYTQTPDQWKINVTFEGNSANGKPNSIYTTSIAPCLWPDQGDTPQKVFCRNPWHFKVPRENCMTQVRTGPAKVSVSNKTIRVVPGWSSNLSIHIVDDYNDDVANVVTAVSSNSELIVVDSSTEYIVDSKLVVHGVVDQHANVQLRTLDPRVIVYNVDVTIQECPPGYMRSYCDNDSQMVCSCKCRTEGLFSCKDDRDVAKAEIYFGYCLTEDRNGSSVLVLGKCLYAINGTLLPRTAQELDEKVCRPYHRTGTLCGRCVPGKGVAINSYQLECVDCHVGYFFAYIAAEILPITIFLIIVAVFHISATSASMNAYVFFSQMITVAYFHNVFPWAFGFGYDPITPATAKHLKVAFLIPYSIWNLDFFASVGKPFCFTTSFQAIHVLLFSYIKAFYPLVIIVVCYICIELHDRNFKCIRAMWKPFRYLLYRFRRTWEPKTSIIDAFATFLLLAYTKLMYVSFSLLVPVDLVKMSDGNLTHKDRFYFDASMDYFGHLHVWYAIAALVVLVVFVAAPPIFLLLYPLKTMQKCLTKCHIRWRGLHTFADAFQGSFKDGTGGTRDWRYFSSAYFFFRIVGFIIYASEPYWMMQYLVQQVLVSLAIFMFAVIRPYKKDFYNGVDAGLFTLLAVVNSISFYNSHLGLVAHHISLPLFVINYALLFVPLVYLVCYIVFLYLRLKGCFLWRPSPLSRAPSESMLVVENSRDTDPLSYIVRELASENDEMPDRLLHPENYHCNSPSPRSSNKSNSSSSKSSRSAASSSQPSQSHSNSSQQSKELVHPVSDDGGGGERLLAVRPQAVYGSVQRRHTEPPSANKQQPQGSIN